MRLSSSSSPVGPLALWATALVVGFACSSAGPASSAGSATDGGPFTSGSTTTDGGGSSTTGSTSNTDGGGASATTETIDAPVADSARLRSRPYTLIESPGLSAQTSAPLILVLHGYGSDGASHASYLGFQSLVRARQLRVAAPDGRIDSRGKRYWNANEACCDFGGVGTDDLGYLTDVVRDVASQRTVDRSRIWVVGHSNGGFMSLELGCDRSAIFSGVVSLAGTALTDGGGCQPEKPVSVLDIHGSADAIIGYGGGRIPAAAFGFASSRPAAYAGAEQTVGFAAQRLGCDSTRTEVGTFDLDATVWGAETRRLAHTGCPAGAAELWRIDGGSHVPTWTATPGFAASVVDWLESHAVRAP